MPHLYFQHRYWRISDDDLFIPLACTLIGRNCWTILILLYFLITYRQLSICKTGIILLIYLALTLLALFSIIMMDLIIMLTSLAGTIVESKKRSSIPILLSIRLVLSYLQVFVGIYGIFGISYADQIPCNGNTERTIVNRVIYIVIVCSQYLDILVLTCCCYLTSSTLVEDDDDDDDGQDANLKAEAEEGKEHSAEGDVENGGKTSSPLHPHYHHAHQPDAETGSITKRWENRFENFMKQIQYYSCNLLGTGNISEEFQDVAKIFTKFFHHEGFLDIVASDIIAGIILVRNEQQWEKQIAGKRVNDRKTQPILDDILIREDDFGTENNQGSKSYSPNSAQFLDISLSSLQFRQQMSASSTNQYGSDEISFLHSLQNYLIYATIIYSSLTLIENENSLHTFLPCLCKCASCMPIHYQGVKIGCCYSYGQSTNNKEELLQQQEEEKLTGINFYARNNSTIRLAELEQSELVYTSFRSDTLHKPYAIFLDHKEEKVIITIRGTQSIEDCITDIECDAVELDQAGKRWGFNGQDRWAHSGMLRAAEAMRDEIETSGILRMIFGNYHETREDVGLHTPLNRRTKFSHYSLIVTGHSLGSGAGIILTLLLKKIYPNIYCYGFGTPGAVLDAQSCLESRSYATTIAFGDDIVCRLGFRPMCKLRDDILESIARAKVCKLRIMLSLLTTYKPSDLMYPRGSEPPSSFKEEAQKFKKAVQEMLNSPDHIDLHLPGRIIHITKDDIDWKCCWSFPTYSFEEKSFEDFTEIPVSKTMVTDHVIDSYFQPITQLLHSRKLHHI